MPDVHELKCDPKPFDDVLSGRKGAEVRKDDRGYAVGDTLLLRETVFTGEQMRAGYDLAYTGRELTREITHIQRGYGLDGLAVLSLSPSGVLEELRHTIKERDDARAEVKRRDEHAQGVTWFWQGDNNDNLDGLTCQVVIRAEDLRSMLSAAAAQPSDNAELRFMLCCAYAGAKFYGDDGELQDNREFPFIDFKRDTVAEIQRKMSVRGNARLAEFMRQQEEKQRAA